MGSTSTEQAVFVDTSLGTYLGIQVSRDITARDFMRQFEREHFECFSESGDIQVSALKVERKASLYRLSDSMAIKDVFRTVGDGSWFLHAEVRALVDVNSPCLHNCVASKVLDHRVTEGSDIPRPSNPEISEVSRHSNPANSEVSRPSNPENSEVSHPSNPENTEVSRPSNPENFVTSTAKSTTEGSCKRRRRKRTRRQRPLVGKLGKLFYFIKRRKRRKNISLPEKVDQTRMNNVVDDTVVPMHIDENKTAPDDCASSKEMEPAEEYLASKSSRGELAETSSQAVVSVSGIINKYFLNLSEEDDDDVSSTTSVTSRVNPQKTKAGDIFSSRQVNHSASTKFSTRYLLPLASPSPTDFEGRRYTHDKPEVGKRLVRASYGLGISPSTKHPVLHLCILRQEKV